METKKFDKNELMKFLQRREIFHGYELVDKLDSPTINLNPAVPSMLIRSVSQFAQKSIDCLELNDAILFYDAVHEISKSIGNSETKIFRNKYNLTFFGIHQYELLNYYLSQIKN